MFIGANLRALPPAFFYFWKKLIMELYSDRLSLREITLDDLDNMYTLSCIPEVDEYNTMGIPSSKEEIRELILPVISGQGKTNQASYIWTIRLRDSHTFIGEAGMFLSNDKFRLGEIYYKFLPSYWGNGYATEVASLLIKTGFNQFKLHKVEAGVATENVKSIAVLEKTGMIPEGLRRKILPIRGKWVDNYHYAIVEDDPRNY